VGHGGYGKW